MKSSKAQQKTNANKKNNEKMRDKKLAGPNRPST